MKPPDFLWETKISSQLKRLVNMARLENATYDEVVTHSEPEVELNRLEEGDDFPGPTMATGPAAARPSNCLIRLAETKEQLAIISRNQDTSKNFKL